jgi:UPF0755 protein
MYFLKKIRKNSYFLPTLIFIFLVISALFFLWTEIYLPVNASSTQSQVFEVAMGQGAKEISDNLQNQGLIRSGFLFQVYVFFEGKAGELQAGDYELSTAMAIPDIAKKIADGNRIKKNITIIEGWDIADVENCLKEQGFSNPAKIFEINKQKKIEGYLFPDTYEIFLEEGVSGAVNKMMANFEDKITPEMRKEIDSQSKSLSDIVIMASLIEKEVKSMADKKIVSGVLWKRIEIGMPLQVDCTIIYATGKDVNRVLYSDLKIDSLYNTYKYSGLPPGPICNPGIDSIVAAIYPQKTTYLYYLSTPAGKTIFSRTLAEHNVAKATYLR